MPKVSIIIPTYNRADMIGDAIQSVLEQVCTDWELIVVDDGSVDNTRQAVESFSDPRIRYIYQENKGLPGARNTGIRASTGEYIAFLDSDDLFLPEKLKLQAAVLNQNPETGLVASGWTEVDAQHRPVRTLQPWRLGRGLRLSDWLYSCPFNVLTVLVRREWLDRVGLFDEQQYYVEDWDLWLRLAYARCRMAWEPAVVCLRTIHEGNMVHNAARMSEGLFRMFTKFFEQPGLPEVILHQRPQIYANAHLNAAVRFLAAGAVDQGTEHLKKAVGLNPMLLDGEPPQALQSLVSTALTHQVRNLESYISDVCCVLPRVSPKLVRSQRQMWAAILATAAFEAIANGHPKRARSQAASALVRDPSWLRNRGLLNILLGRYRMPEQ
jgi:glycosyltransferase involved in cell wall biosynthesis